MTDKLTPEEQAKILSPEEIDRINRQKDKLTVLVAVVGPLVLVLILLGVSVWFGWWAT
jgi:hypothetical protein